jgi:hypothetical protein
MLVVAQLGGPLGHADPKEPRGAAKKDDGREPPGQESQPRFEDGSVSITAFREVLKEPSGFLEGDPRENKVLSKPWRAEDPSIAVNFRGGRQHDPRLAILQCAAQLVDLKLRLLDGLQVREDLNDCGETADANRGEKAEHKLDRSFSLGTIAGIPFARKQ